MFLKQFKDAIRDAGGQFDSALQILLDQSVDSLQALPDEDFVFIKRVLEKLKTKKVSKERLKQAYYKIELVEKRAGRKKLVLSEDDSSAQFVERLLKETRDLKAEVLHLRVGRMPVIRIGGSLRELAGHPQLEAQTILGVASEVFSPAHMAYLSQNRMVSFSLSMAGISRFRVSAYYEGGQLAISFKQIPFDLPSLEDIGVGREITDTLFQLHQGMVLISGPAVSGKSTTCAAILDWLNHHRSLRVLSLEDPIEYLFRDVKSSITQREVGSDLQTLEDGLRYALKGGPNWIFLSEIRTREALEFAINAAENGKVVLSTVAAVSTSQALESLASLIASDGITLMERFSQALSLVITQNLGPSKEGKGMVCAREVMIPDANLRTVIRESRWNAVHGLLESAPGSLSLGRSWQKLIRMGQIEMNAALESMSERELFESRYKAQLERGLKEGEI